MSDLEKMWIPSNVQATWVHDKSNKKGNYMNILI